jgi:malic enzyme
MAISIGKLALYTAAAGIDPALVLPVSLDVGTDNESLLADPFYLGWPEKRLRGDAYLGLLDEFVDAVAAVFPGAVVQWEDFRKDNALRILDRYRDRIPSFNDDIQGTGAVALAGILTAERVSRRALRDERVVILGGGAAGLGIARQIRAGMRASGADAGSANSAIAVLDSKGLIVDDGGLSGYKRELALSEATSRQLGLATGNGGLQDVIERFRPTVLIGTSGQAGAFTENVIRTMAGQGDRPVILPLSNPTASCEAQPHDIFGWTDGRALVATGSPFPDVEFAGRRWPIGQGNNAYIFPGVGLAALVSGCPTISADMFLAAARALSESLTDSEARSGLLFPPIARSKEVTVRVALAALREADTTQKDWERLIAEFRWEPEYPRYEPA